MKVILLLLLAVLIFFSCAALGYQFANLQEGAKAGNTAGKVDDLGGEQHNLILIRVDQVNSENPRLISVWFVSLYFFNDLKPTLTLVQLYPTKTATPSSEALTRSFRLSGDGDPAAAFWKSVEAYNIDWEGYVMVDTAGAGEVLDWLIAPGDYQSVLDTAEVNQDENKRLAEQICASIVGAPDRDIGVFDWSVLVPTHFRSSLRMETGLSYWARMTNAENPVRCEIIMAP